MKSCPTCNRTFEDNLTYCLVDGSILSAPFDPATRGNDAPPTEIMLSKSEPGPTRAAPSPVLPPAPTIPAMFQQAAVPPVRAEESWAPARREQKPNLPLRIVGGIALLLVIVVAVMVLRSGSPPTTANNTTANKAAASNANMMATPSNTATPDEGKVHREKGDVFKAEKRYAEAETEYREAIRLNPNDSNAHISLAYVFTRLDRNAEAEAEYRQALRVKPDMEPTRAAAVHYNIGKALYDQNKYTEAEAEYREAIRLDPNMGSAHMNLGLALYQQARYNEAEYEEREAVRLNPNEVNPHRNLAAVLEKQNKSSEAKAEYAKADQLKKNQ